MAVESVFHFFGILSDLRYAGFYKSCHFLSKSSKWYIKIYAYDEIESSVLAEESRTGRLSRVLSIKEVQSDHEVLGEWRE